MEKLKNYFENCGFKGNDLDMILVSFRLQEFKKHDFFLKIGRLNNYFGFIQEGIFLHYVSKEDEMKTTDVSIENTFIASRLSFVNEDPATENIQALTNGNVCLINKNDLKKLTDEVPKFKDFYIGLLERSIDSLDSSRHDLILLSGEERYEKLLKNEPNLLQIIPLQYLASLLGVTPRHLSRIRKNVR